MHATHSPDHRRRTLLMAGALAWPAKAAQAGPGTGMRMLVAYPAGGISDLVARALAEDLARQWSVAVVVENRPGASGTLALELLARSTPDGRTLAFAAATAAGMANAAVAPVAGVMRTPMLLVGTPALKATDFAGMLAEARDLAGGIRWATTGEGTTGHAVLRRIGQASGIPIVHVPYKGGGQQLNDALAGHFELLSTNVAPLQLQALRAGRLKALAVGAPRRLAVLPGVPTLAELGHARANLDSLFGLFAPPRTPPAVVEHIHAGVVQALHGSTIRSRLEAAGNQPFEGSTTDFARQVARETGR
ncbi:Argininosuccinate lyase [Delftia tsuruhatensis]|uniref:Bug family tripartite tricarboxylate transporter substrate binding protein n=1 Tax=Delftia tsuruhatensis TaxID=180282 RepID=UPI001E7CC593|nr:tripartite tricarboxylate transporter substrate binding protein [Delftia tsuruhatensis]CAB5686745.1 Argininosuccinate lyase [Delftia tsuruhatensis]CAC9690495.1 Argininosuccinate lyase [Delftia tsuruhatensis]